MEGICHSIIYSSRFDVRSHVVMNNGSKVKKAGDRAYFPILAKRDIRAGEEIIVNYGICYWKSIAEYKKGPKEKPKSARDRDARILARQQRQMANAH
jgi:SET domain-containing protein